MQETSYATQRTSFLTRLAYSCGQITGQIFRDIPSLLLLFFLTNIVGIEPGLAGMAIFVPKLIVGVLSDFAVGIVSQRHPKSWPKWLLAGAFFVPIALALLFRVPDASSSIQILYVVIVFSFYMSVYSIFSVPYLAIASKLSDDPHQRTVLMAWRLAFTAVGVLISSGVAPAFVSSQGGGLAAYESLGYLLAVLCTATLLIAYFGVRNDDAFALAGDKKADVSQNQQAIFTFDKLALLKPRFVVLVIANLMQLTASGMAYAAFLYYLIYNMGRADAFTVIGILILITCAGIILSQPVWVALSKKFGKQPIFIASAFLHSFVALCFGVSGGGISMSLMYFLIFMLGVGNSGWTLLGFSMVSDLSSEESGGVYSAAWVAADKIGFALGGTALIGLILSSFGFSAENAVAGLPQSDRAVLGIAFAYGYVPALLLAASAIFFAIFGREKESNREG